MDEAVLQWFRNEHKLEIGLGMSEKIKKTVGSAMKMKSADVAVKEGILCLEFQKQLKYPLMRFD